MNDNVFAYNQINLDMQRSGFDLSHDVLTTFDTGDLIPLGTPVEVLAGDTFDMKLNAVVRMTTPIFPVMGNRYLDVFGFFVPGRLIYDYWEELHGRNKTTAWEPTCFLPSFRNIQVKNSQITSTRDCSDLLESTM